MKLSQVKLSKIKPYWRNPRINDNTIEILKESIKKFGFNNPLTIDKDNVIITGHSRYKACVQLQGKMTEYIAELQKDKQTKLANNLEPINNGLVWVIQRDDLSPKKVRELRITDNKISELSSWDFDNLKFELRELESVIGFTEDELQRLVSDLHIPIVTEDDVIEKEQQMEQHWEPTENRFQYVTIGCPHCGESFEISEKDIQTRKLYK